MITVEITKRELLRQLPEKAGYALMQWLEEMPLKFTFEAMPIQTKPELLEESFAELKRACTPTQWRILVTLHGRGKVYAQAIAETVGLIPHDAPSIHSNNLSVQVKNLRHRLAETNSPFQIVTYRGSNGQTGQYELLSILQ
jgi:hypothetical protein